MLSVTSMSGPMGTKLVAISVTENGTFQGEIRGLDGTVESVTTAKTAADVLEWLQERQTADVEWEEV